MPKETESWGFIGFAIGFAVAVIVCTVVCVRLVDFTYQEAYRDYRDNKIEDVVRKHYPALWIKYHYPPKESKK